MCVYSLNVGGTFDHNGIGLDNTFKELETNVGASIFILKKTHSNTKDTVTRKVLRTSQRKIWNSVNGDHCQIVANDSTAQGIGFRKSGGIMLGTIGKLVGRVQECINDHYGCWSRVCYKKKGRPMRKLDCDFAHE